MKKTFHIETVPIEESSLKEWLRADRLNVADYLQSALESGDADEFILALRDVATAFGIAELAKAIKMSRSGLYKMLSDKGEPGFRSMLKLIKMMRLQLHVTAAPERQAARPSAKRKVG